MLRFKKPMTYFLLPLLTAMTILPFRVLLASDLQDLSPGQIDGYLCVMANDGDPVLTIQRYFEHNYFLSFELRTKHLNPLAVENELEKILTASEKLISYRPSYELNGILLREVFHAHEKQFPNSSLYIYGVSQELFSRRDEGLDIHISADNPSVFRRLDCQYFNNVPKALGQDLKVNQEYWDEDLYPLRSFFSEPLYLLVEDGITQPLTEFQIASAKKQILKQWSDLSEHHMNESKHMRTYAVYDTISNLNWSLLTYDNQEGVVITVGFIGDDEEPVYALRELLL